MLRFWRWLLCRPPQECDEVREAVDVLYGIEIAMWHADDDTEWQRLDAVWLKQWRVCRKLKDARETAPC